MIAPAPFDFEFSLHSASALVRSALDLPAFTAHWIGDASGFIHKDVSEKRLTRIRISAWTETDLKTAGELIIQAAADLTDDELTLEPVYQDGPRVTGWLFYREKEPVKP